MMQERDVGIGCENVDCCGIVVGLCGVVVWKMGKSMEKH